MNHSGTQYVVSGQTGTRYVLFLFPKLVTMKKAAPGRNGFSCLSCIAQESESPNFLCDGLNAFLRGGKLCGMLFSDAEHPWLRRA